MTEYGNEKTAQFSFVPKNKVLKTVGNVLAISCSKVAGQVRIELLNFWLLRRSCSTKGTSAATTVG